MIRMVLCFCFLILSTNSYSQSVLEIRENNQAVDYITEEKLSKAAQTLHKLIALNPDLALAKINLSSVYSLNQDPAKAIALLEELELELSIHTEKQKEVSETVQGLLFISRFNLASLYSADKESLKKAVDMYGMALEIYPNDLATKYNIELLVQQQNQQNKSDKSKEDEEQKEGKGENKDKKEQKKDNKPKPQPPKQEKTKPQKKKFKENELKKRDVKRIFDELKRQEEKIRAKENKQNQQEQEVDKDW